MITLFLEDVDVIEEVWISCGFKQLRVFVFGMDDVGVLFSLILDMLLICFVGFCSSYDLFG